MSNQAYYNELSDWVSSHSATPKWQYRVPLLGEGGSCSIFNELDDTPFDLTAELHEQEKSLVPTLQAVVDWVKHKTQIDWFGIYLGRVNKSEDRVLTKLAYFGKPSRAEFPLSEDFAQISNNSKVGLTGEERVINDVESYVAQGGEYYTCDPKVKSELCWPILTPQVVDKNQQATYNESKILGIIDAECFKTNCFDDHTQAIFKAVCQLLSQVLTTSPQKS